MTRLSIPRALGPVLLLCAVWAAGDIARGSPGQPLRAAAACLSAGNFCRAAELFARAENADRMNAVAYAGQGTAELLGGRVQAARAAFNSAAILEPRLAAAHLGLGACACLEGDFAGARLAFQTACACPGRRPAQALAGLGYASCALGLYDSAAQYATSALQIEPGHSLALYVLAAADLARGDGKRAASLVGTISPPLPAGPAVVLPSCLYGPGMAFAQAHLTSHRLPPPPAAMVVPAAAAEAEQSPEFRITSPRPGEALTKATVVEVSAAEGLGVEYVTVLINDAFAGISTVRPYRVSVDPRLFSAGPGRVQAEGCGAGGRVLRRASIPVLLQPANRTLAPEETAGREAVAELLESLVLPPLPAVASRQLAGNGLLQEGQLNAAAVAFESAYALDAELPGLREDLLEAYRSLGLRSVASAPEIHTIRQPRKSVALTFDDGPHPLITPWILDELDKEGVKATFFLVGKQATLYPELVGEIRRRGHQIGCHSYAHYSLRNFSAQECEQDLVKCRLALREACGETVTLFRPPGGYCDATVRAAAGALGFTTVFWSCNITSYPGREGRHIAAELARQSADGGIILLHNGEDETLDTLPYLIPELRRRGVTFVTLSPELAASNGHESGGRDR